MNQFDIYQVNAEPYNIYLITPRKGFFRCIGFTCKLLWLDIQKDKSVKNILRLLYKQGFRFLPKNKRSKNDKMYNRERIIVKNLGGQFITKHYNKEIGRIGFDEHMLCQLYHIHKNIFGWID